MKIAADEMSIAEKKAHESAREVFFHAAVQCSFASDYPQLMPFLMNHWKSKLITIMQKDKYSSELVEKVNTGTPLIDDEDKCLVYPLIDSLIWEIHPVLKEVNQRLISEKLGQFIATKQAALNKQGISFENQIKGLQKNKPKTEEGIQKLESHLCKLQQELDRINDQLKMLQSPLSYWEREVFEEFKKTFFEKREVGQCVEPIFAKVLGHDHFFPIYLSKSKPIGCIPDATSSSHVSELQLGNIHPEYVIPPCDKNCQINALAHLYTSDLLRENQSTDLLNTIRITQSVKGVPERIFSSEELNACLTS